MQIIPINNKPAMQGKPEMVEECIVEQCYIGENESTFHPSIFKIAASKGKADAEAPVYSVSATKHSLWDLDKHWLEIKTSDNKIYQCFLNVKQLYEIEYLEKGEELVIQNEQILFDRFGYSSFDLFIPRLNQTIIVEGVSTIPYQPVHHGKEVHAIFEAYRDPVEKSLSFIIESGQKLKLFFNDEKDLESFESGQEFEIFSEESIYEKYPLLLLGIKNVKTDQEYIVKADALYRWQPTDKDRYRIMSLVFYTYRDGEGFINAANLLKNDTGENYFIDPIYEKYHDHKIVILENIGVGVEHSGSFTQRPVYAYKFLNLNTREIFTASSYDWRFHERFKDWPR